MINKPCGGLANTMFFYGIILYTNQSQMTVCTSGVPKTRSQKVQKDLYPLHASRRCAVGVPQ